MLWGGLSDKNNPFLDLNKNNDRLIVFPTGVALMNPHEPYMEFRVGIHNILKVLSVEYVHRINYHELPTATKNGVRFGFRFSF